MSTVGLLAVLATLSVLAAGTLALRTATDSGWDDTEIWEARRGAIDVMVPASGELAALKQTEIINKLQARAVITEAVAEGTLVKKGDVLLRFKDDEIRQQLKEAEDGVISAESTVEGAEADLEIKQRGRESAVAKAKVDVELATLALNSWLEGESVSKLEELTVAVTTAEKSYERQKKRYDSSAALVDKGFISDDQMRGDEIAFIDAEAHLNKARRDLDVYQKYTYIKERTEKESTLKQAQDELIRVQKSQDAEVHKAESNVFTAQRRLDSVQQWHDNWTEQIDNCTVTAPQDGLVVYASSLQEYSWMRHNNMSIQPGSEMYHNQLLMVLPDTSQMVASVKVNEAISGTIKPGQTANVTCDAAPGRIMQGTVESIGVLAESGNNWNNRKEYTVRIKIDDVGGLELKPAMRCKADIEVDRVEDIIFVPLQAVHHEGENHFVYVPRANGSAQRKVTVGKSSDLYIEIAEGLAEGERVLLVVPEADEIIERIEKNPNPGSAGDVLVVDGDGDEAASDEVGPNSDVLATPEVEVPDSVVTNLDDVMGPPPHAESTTNPTPNADSN